MQEEKKVKKDVNNKKKSNKHEKELENKIQELEEKVLYHQAEVINYRKRKDEETANLLKFANKDLILEILVVLDNFERALKLGDKENSNFLEGFRMIYTNMVEILKNYGLEEIDAENKEFDPNLHDALMIDKNPDKENGIVLEVLVKGYMLKGKVIRPATVKINQLD